MKNKEKPSFGGTGYYETGSTNPPRSHNGCILVPLAAVIILGSILTVLGLLNIRLFAGDTAHYALGFDTVPTESSGEAPLQPQSETVDIPLNTTPATLPHTDAMPYHEIYDRTVPSVVSVLCDTGVGNGVILTGNGYIVTNCHTVSDASIIEVLLSDGRTLTATTVGADPITDLAVLQVEATDLTAAVFGDSDDVRVGDPVAAIGDPLGSGQRMNMNSGAVIAIREAESSRQPLFLTNATLPNGNAGGPLLNFHGQIIGIHTVTLRPAGIEGVASVIPSATVKQVAEQLILSHTTGRPTLGLTGNLLSSLDALYYRLPHGFYVTDVAADSDAAAKGIRPGDVLTMLNGTPITDLMSLRSQILSCSAGDPVEVTFYRDGHYYTLTVTVSLTEPTG